MKRYMLVLCQIIVCGVVGVDQSSAGVEGRWRLVVPATMGIGVGSRYDEDTGAKESLGLGLSFDVYEFAFGFRRLNQVGLGVKFMEDISFLSGFESARKPWSLVPVYIYYPLYSSKAEFLHENKKPVRRKFLYVFAGGSKWGFNNHYWHTGISWIINSGKFEDLGTGTSTDLAGMIVDGMIRAVPTMNVGLRAGLYGTSHYRQDVVGDESDLGFYVKLTFGIGAAVEAP